MAVRRKHIQTLVERILTSQGIRSAPIPVEDIVKALGVEIHLESVDDNLSGFLYRDAKLRRAVIGVNSTHHPNRQRFTIAHELGHFLLHEGEMVHVHTSTTQRAFQIKRRDKEAAKGIDDDEKEANLFAAELLMPASFLERDIAKINDIEKLDILDEDELKAVLKPLADQYRVSTQAFIFRLAYLNYIRL